MLYARMEASLCVVWRNCIDLVTVAAPFQCPGQDTERGPAGSEWADVCARVLPAGGVRAQPQQLHDGAAPAAYQRAAGERVP